MKINTLLLLAISVNLMGCSSPYVKNRIRDAADIFTFTTGVGAGGKAKIGPISTGLDIQEDSIGIRNGAFFAANPTPSSDFRKRPGGTELYYTWLGFDISNHGEVVTQRGKEFSVATAFLPTGWYDTDSMSKLPLHYFTQIEVTAGAGLGFRVGFNPGELVDFILGWATLDLFKDDVVKFEKTNIGGIGSK